MENHEFKFSDRVKIIKSGFYEGCYGTVVDYFLISDINTENKIIYRIKLDCEDFTTNFVPSSLKKLRK